MQDDTKPPLEERTDNQAPVFYYSRSRRLEKASPAVQELNREDAFKKRTGLWNLFVANKSNLFLLVFIGVLCVLITLVSIFTKERSGFKLDGNSVTISAMNFEGMTYISIKKNIKDSIAYTGLVSIAVTPIVSVEKKKSDETSPVSIQQVFFTQAKEEDYRFSFPFEASNLLVILETENERLSLTIKPK